MNQFTKQSILAILISMIVLLLVLIFIYDNPEVQEHNEKVKSGLEYGCKGTASEILNCQEINRKLDLILEKLE